MSSECLPLQHHSSFDPGYQTYPYSVGSSQLLPQAAFYQPQQPLLQQPQNLQLHHHHQQQQQQQQQQLPLVASNNCAGGGSCFLRGGSGGAGGSWGSCRSRRGQAGRLSLHEFRPCPSDRSARSLGPGHPAGIDGVLRVHVVAGTGLHAPVVALRDLYCLLELDSVRMARSLIRTSTECFHWDEQFDLFAAGARGLGFLLYQWDPSNKHRLCFHGSVNLVSLAASFRHRCIRSERIALGMEPKGCLYFELTCYSISEVMCRTQSPRMHSSIFGVPIDILVRREKSGQQVPLLVQKCIDEVERRGLDIPGIYRLCGSNKSKISLREAFERRPGKVDLSADKVPDIHAVTGLLKDFVRELPEPLFTNALYRMLLDALAVEIPGDPRGGAKLMLSILDCLPPVNQETLVAILDHLKRVALRSDANKMTLDQLATCLGPLLLYPSPDSARIMEASFLQLGRMSHVLQYILDIWVQSDTPPQPRRGSGASRRSNSSAAAAHRRARSAGSRSHSNDRRSYHGDTDRV
ncbi:hypothetical protein BOX15_Mlig014851g2 [Macrostomum lignano]|nr:hypothetical protein BOX15_Mlig014851g2 [Macrostomum lignano]